MNQTTASAAESPKNGTEGKSFLQEAGECWRAMPDKALFLSLLGGWLLLFQFLGNATFGYVNTPSMFHWMYTSYNKPPSEDGHGNLIPFVVLALFWWKRGELLAVPKRTWWPGLLIVFAALLLHVCAYVVQQPLPSLVAMFAGIYGLMGLVWGPAWLRACAFPYFLFAFSLPMGTNIDPLTLRLRLLVTMIVSWISNGLFGLDVVRQGTQLFDSQHSFQYEVAAACSGIRSLVAIIAMATIYSFVAFGSWWKRAVMMLSAFPLAVASNVFRMMFIVITAEAFGQQAGNYVHESQIFSLLPYIPGIVGLILLERWLKADATPRERGRSEAVVKTS